MDHQKNKALTIHDKFLVKAWKCYNTQSIKCYNKVWYQGMKNYRNAHSYLAFFLMRTFIYISKTHAWCISLFFSYHPLPAGNMEINHIIRFTFSSSLQQDPNSLREQEGLWKRNKHDERKKISFFMVHMMPPPGMATPCLDGGTRNLGHSHPKPPSS